ncbi:MAG TPA: DUF5654 family protein [Candidatus Nanoarchaeia archaeon]|nr:DUF5654 family protein [Candidatus Nanoarchaeia archaeon]
MEISKKQITEIKQELEKHSSVDEIQGQQINKLQQELAKQKEKTKFALDLSLKSIKVFEQEVKKQVITAVVAAFGFLLALVWRDTIVNYTTHIVDFFRFPASESFGILYSTLITTFVAVIGIVLVSKFSPKKDEILREIHEKTIS